MLSLARVAIVATLALALGTGEASAGPAVPLNQGQETTAVRRGGHGFFTYTIEDDELCYTLEVSGLTDDPIGAHIHLGDRNQAGPIVVPLETPPSATSTVSDCITAVEGGALTPDELAAIAADPRSFYVNVHTPEYPGGEVRGQLK